jgi:methyl-accepting chemotaxis protein
MSARLKHAFPVAKQERKLSSPSALIVDNAHRPKEAAVDEQNALRAELAGHRQWMQRALYVLEQAAQGNLEERLLGCEGDSDLVRLSHALNQTLDLTDAFVRESGAALDAAAHKKFYRKVLLRGLLGSFRHAATLINSATDKMSVQSAALAASEAEQKQLAGIVAEVASSVASAAATVEATAQSLKQSADSTADQASSVATASEVTSEIVQTVAAATEELSATAAEIERLARRSAQIAEGAVLGVERTNATVGELATAQTKIGSVVKTISEVAGQTNLLALNATIEAARAGQAGKGFAVVAAEVKSLAQQTASATESIHSEVSAVQSAAVASGTAIVEIGKTIRGMDEVSKSILLAIDEQRVATRQIGENIQQAATATRDVSRNIMGLNTAAQQTSGAVDGLLRAAGELSGLGETLKASVQQLLQKSRVS